jgi:hypothetical protein
MMWLRRTFGRHSSTFEPQQRLQFCGLRRRLSLFYITDYLKPFELLINSYSPPHTTKCRKRTIA